MYAFPSNDLSVLQDRAIALADRAAQILARKTAQSGDTQRELHVAATWHVRRSAKPGSVDNLVYAHGSAEQALRALDVCPVTMTGFKAAGAVAYPWLMNAAERVPDGSFVDHVRIALEDPSLRLFCVELGALVRWDWKHPVYKEAVVNFESKPIAKSPRAAWRRRAVTRKQAYLIEMAAECLSAVDLEWKPPVIRDRGEAHDWLLEVGGNPTYWRRPTPPAPPTRTHN